MKKLILLIILVLSTHCVYAQEDTEILKDSQGRRIGDVKQLKFPLEANTLFKKYAFCYMVKERLRRQHNKKGEKFRNGEITQEQWDKYKIIFRQKNSLVNKKLNQLRKRIKNSDTFNIKLKYSELFEDV